MIEYNKTHDKFLPVTQTQLEQNGIKQPDFVLITGDAYVDHPSFGAAIIGRLLVQNGYSVGVITQPDINDKNSFAVFNKPRLGFLVTGGNIDSMVNHYTVAKKKRTKDLYSPGGKAGKRPDRATIVYSAIIRRLYKNVPIIIGGIEASLRRLSHYDYWSNKVRRSILLDSEADLLVYGMGERQIIEIADALQSGLPVSELTFINGTVYKTPDISRVTDYIGLPAYEQTSMSKRRYAESYMLQYENTDPITAKPLVEHYGNVYVVQNPPQPPLTTSELDNVFNLPYTKEYHPMYEKDGGIPAIEEVRFSIVNNRGCFGCCSFCALTFHQGRVVQVRSFSSVIDEAKKMTAHPLFKGYIHDVGGPTANFSKPSCKTQLTKGLCKHRQCLFPKPCPNLTAEHKDYLTLLRALRELPGIKKVFIRSGIRYDYLMADNDGEFFKELVKHHISGQLKVAPEHISDKVLKKMGKPSKDVYETFVKKYYAINDKFGMKQFLVPYFMSSHPGSDLKAAIELAEYIHETGISPEQVQDFYPTPGTLATCMYYTELDPRTMEPVFVAKSPHEKAMQRALIQYKLPQNHSLVLEALKKAERTDLIGFDKKCLVPPRLIKGTGQITKRPQKQAAQQPKKAIKPKKKTIRNVHAKKK